MNLRYELKLIADAHRLAEARSWIRLHPEGFMPAVSEPEPGVRSRTTFPPRWVNNIYFDTVDLGSFRENLSGVSSRHKLRLRWYGDSKHLVSESWLELKRKENMLGDKLRHHLQMPIDFAQPWREIMPAIRVQIPPQWQTLFSPMLQPTLHNRYFREYYVSRDGAIRVTLDSSQTAADQQKYQRPNLQAQLPLEQILVIEIKGKPERTDRIQAAMNYFPRQRSRNSKYVNGIMASLSF